MFSLGLMSLASTMALGIPNGTLAGYGSTWQLPQLNSIQLLLSSPACDSFPSVYIIAYNIVDESGLSFLFAFISTTNTY